MKTETCMACSVLALMSAPATSCLKILVWMNEQSNKWQKKLRFVYIADAMGDV